MQLFGRLNLLALVIAFVVGLMMTYMIKPPPKVIIKFPSPYNAGKVTYRDNSDTCFMYRSDEVDCKDASVLGVLPQPLLFEDFRAKGLSSMNAPVQMTI